MATASAVIGFDLSPFLLVPNTGGTETLVPSDWVGGLVARNALDVRIDNAASVLYHILFPANADTVISSGVEGFSYSTFPLLINTETESPILDPNGLPLDFTRIRLVAARVRKIDPTLDAGGILTITTADSMVPGNAFGITAAEDTRLAAVADPAGWAPDPAGSITVAWEVTTAATIADINLFAELVIIGDPIPPD